MKRSRQLIFAAALAAILPAQAQNLPPSAPPAVQNVSGKTPSVPANLLPPAPQSPVNFFRTLLAMSARERTDSLTNRPAAVREKILAKVREYQSLPPDERELRLRATDLRWYLMPLMRQSPADRAARLAEVPADLQTLVKTRLGQWDILPPPMQQQLLANDHALHYFAQVETTNQVAAAEEREKVAAQFNQFFELTPAEKASALNVLSAAEREQMEKTLQSFSNLPPQQRLQCVRNFSKFAGMTGAERAQFLKNAERWAELPAQERQVWRELVAHVPEWPPMPPTVVPASLIPHVQPRPARPNVATNLD